MNLTTECFSQYAPDIYASGGWLNIETVCGVPLYEEYVHMVANEQCNINMI